MLGIGVLMWQKKVFLRVTQPYLKLATMRADKLLPVVTAPSFFCAFSRARMIEVRHTCHQG